MSFGLLTAVNVSDVPFILRRIARAYRNVETREYKAAWLVVAEKLEQTADELAPLIEEAKRAEPKPRRVRQRL